MSDRIAERLLSAADVIEFTVESAAVRRGVAKLLRKAAADLSASEAARQQAEQERDDHWADLCEVRVGGGLIARALYDEAMERAKRAESKALALSTALRAILDMAGSHTVPVNDPHPAGYSAIWRIAEAALSAPDQKQP